MIAAIPVPAAGKGKAAKVAAPVLSPEQQVGDAIETYISYA